MNIALWVFHVLLAMATVVAYMRYRVLPIPARRAASTSVSVSSPIA